MTPQLNRQKIILAAKKTDDSDLLSQEEDKSNKDSQAPQEHLSGSECLPKTPLEQPNSQTDNTNTSQQTNNQIYNPYQQQRRTGATVTQSPDNPAYYSQHQDNTSLVNQSTLNTKLAHATHRLTLQWKPTASYHKMATDHPKTEFGLEH
jgi:hypothetical protein